MTKQTIRTTAIASTIALIGVSAATTFFGCKGGNGPDLGSSFSSITSAFGGGSSQSSHTNSSSSSGSSSNGMVDAASGMMPNGTGGYLQAGATLLSAANIGAQDEDGIGQAVAIGVTNQYPIFSDQSVNDYVAMVGYTVVSASPRPDGNFLFGVLDTDQVGAFSGPNGYVMITRGAIAKMQDEGELAGVLAHEIAHVCNEDGLNAIKNSRMSDAASQAMKTALQSNDRTAELNVFADTGVDATLRKPYDRGQEDNADRNAVKFIAAAGYDPACYQRFVQRIAQEQGNATTLFSTHPGFADRAGKVAGEVTATGKAGTGATNADRFKAATAMLH